MAYAVKIITRIQAWELGAGSDMEKEMIRCGKIVAHPGGSYELFSREAPEGKGQMAKAGDFLKVDEKGYPRPQERSSFLQEHQHLEGDWYQQEARPRKIWRLGDPDCEEIRFLLDRGLLRIRPDDPRRCFSAFLWETEETAASDAVIVFFGVDRDPEGRIAGINFNFVDKEYFNTHYRVITP